MFLCICASTNSVLIIAIPKCDFSTNSVPIIVIFFQILDMNFSHIYTGSILLSVFRTYFFQFFRLVKNICDGESHL